MISSVLFKSALLTTGLLCVLQANGQSESPPELLGKEINTEYNEIGPVISPDGKTLYFSRISHPQNSHGPDGSQDIWYSEFRNNRWTNAVRMPAVINKEVYNAIYSITPDGNTILLKGSYQKGVYQTRGFSISKRIRRTWSAPETLDIPDYEKMSKGEFDCGFLSNDGQVLLMSFSEKKKGRNDDIYVSFKGKDGKWSKPQSLGPDINTANYMETTPFLAADGVTLYFSSDRPGGHGGNDIYMSRRIDGTWKKWSKPVNLGPLVNTPGFEGYYSVSAAGDYAYWSSNHEGVTQKGDIFRRSLKPVEPEQPKDTSDKRPTVVIADRKDITAPEPVVMITGKVLDPRTKRPIEAQILFQSFPDGRDIGTASTDPETGEYKFTLPYGSVYTMRPVAPGYIAETERIDLTDTAMSRSKRRDLFVNPTDTSLIAESSTSESQPLTNQAERDSILIANTDKPKGVVDRQIASQDTSSDEAKVVPDTTYVRTYQEMDRDLTLVEAEVGGVVRLNNIFFETARSRLLPESKLELDQMVAILNAFPTMEIELAGHTDSEGSEESNLKLSQARSDAVKSYLIEKGIAAERVKSVGYGESMPVATNATAEGRQANRRVEFKILKK